MTYTSIQFIAHCINTGPKIVGQTQMYMGIVAASTDINERIKLVARAIETARTNSNTKKDDPNVLKLFMMPEFFFRGRDGAYSMDEVQTVIKHLQDLVKEQSKWEHWIFVFGSILGKSSPTKVKVSGGSRRLDIDPEQEEVYNFVLIQEGGFGTDAEKKFKAAKVVMKEHKSDIDFIKKDQSVGGAVLERVLHPLTQNQQKLEAHLRNLLKLTDSKLQDPPTSFTPAEVNQWKTEKVTLTKLLNSPKEKFDFFWTLRNKLNYATMYALIQKYLATKGTDALKLLLVEPRSEEPLVDRTGETIGYSGSSVFRLKGFTFGLEVCLDHAMERLANSTSLPDIDIQLLPSCGMNIVGKATVAKHGGYIFNCDGLMNKPGEDKGCHSRVMKIKTQSDLRLNLTTENFQSLLGIPSDWITYFRNENSTEWDNFQQIVENEINSKNLVNVTNAIQTYKKVGYFWPKVLHTKASVSTPGWAEDVNDIGPSIVNIDPINPTKIRINEIYPKGAGQLHIYPEQVLSAPLSVTKSLFPHMQSSFTFSLSDKPVMLNGMKVIFDQPVGVYPVNLESKEEARRNGT
jgi:hypothetical protein